MKIKFSAFTLFFCLFLTSCASISGYGEPEDRYIVSAIGFDRVGEALEVSVQIVGNEGEKDLIRSGRGENVRQAMGHIEGADAKQLEISHCALIVIGDSIDKNTLSDIFDYCRKNNDITVGVKVAAAYNAKELLSLDGANGYELIGAIRDNADGVGFTKGSRFYEIEEIRASEDESVYHLPYFFAGEDSYSVEGLKIYRADIGIVRLDRSESAYYMMIKGKLQGGVADIEYEGGSDSVYVVSSKIKRREEENNLYLTLEIEVNRELMGEDEDKVIKGMSAAAEKLCRELTDRYGDVFGFGDKEIFVECKLKRGALNE